LLPQPDEDEPIHRLLGHPDQIQGDMQLECQMVAHALKYGDPRIALVAPTATEWRLLLQVDSDKIAGMCWGDAGRLYYWIRRDALQSGRWEEAHLILQCY
jgi:uncharacterized protein YwqG